MVTSDVPLNGEQVYRVRQPLADAFARPGAPQPAASVAPWFVQPYVPLRSGLPPIAVAQRPWSGGRGPSAMPHPELRASARR
jgi:hypothetical protein